MGRVVLVTAAGQGLGRALAERFLQAGDRVYAHARHLRSDAPAGIEWVTADLAEASGRAALVERVVKGAGRLDVLVNNLGVYEEKTLDQYDAESFEMALRLNCVVAFDLCRAFAEPLSQTGQGAVVNIGDSYAERVSARAEALPYHIAKVGLLMLTRTLAREWAGRGVRVNMVSPGFLENSVGTVANLPMGRPGGLAEVADAVEYLCSDRASYVSGSHLVVSGAWNT